MYLFRFLQMIFSMTIVILKQTLLSVVDRDLDRLHHIRDHARMRQNIQSSVFTDQINKLDDDLSGLTQYNQKITSLRSVITLFVKVQHCYIRNHKLRIMTEQDEAMYSLFEYCVRGENG